LAVSGTPLWTIVLPSGDTVRVGKTPRASKLVTTRVSPVVVFLKRSSNLNSSLAADRPMNYNPSGAR
jgi:hypothetical protein